MIPGVKIVVWPEGRKLLEFGDVKVMPLEFRLRDVQIYRPAVDPHMVELRLVAEVIDRETGAPREAVFSSRMPERTLSDASFLRHQLLAAFAHEIDECLFKDGKHVRDPHPPPKIQTSYGLASTTEAPIQSIPIKNSTGEQ